MYYIHWVIKDNANKVRCTVFIDYRGAIWGLINTRQTECCSLNDWLSAVHFQNRLGSGTLSSSIICPLHSKLPGNNTSMLPSPPLGQDLCLYNKLYSLGTFESHGDNADRLSVLCHTHNCYVGIMKNGGTSTGLQSFYKFNCTLIRANLRQPDAIWEPDCPVRRADQRNKGLPERNKHVSSDFWWDTLHD